LFTIGYQLKVWREARGVILPKANKENYSLPKSYRPISLLNCLGKTLEKIFATRLGYLASTTSLLQDSQLGGRRQRSAIDAVLLLLNNIQSKNSRKKARQRIATTLFLDVKGAFNHVSENQLLSICKELGLPIAFTQWVATFLSNRKLQLSFNRQIQEKVELETGIL